MDRLADEERISDEQLNDLIDYYERAIGSRWLNRALTELRTLRERQAVEVEKLAGEIVTDFRRVLVMRCDFRLGEPVVNELIKLAVVHIRSHLSPRSASPSVRERPALP